MKTKVIVITGGVYSSLGKGIVAASIGRILKEFKFNVVIQKFDPYLNIDPGTLSPYQHGEVFVTIDGAETDLDLGHYERFIDSDLNKFSSVTAGRVYHEILNDERQGKFNGNTVQVIPHVTKKIQEKINAIIKVKKPDFLIIEIGGTIGDIESLPFIESLREYANVNNRKNIMFIHCAPIIKVSATNEIKTKPIQHSVKSLMNLGIYPDLLVLRTDEIVSDSIKQKLSWTCNINKDNIFCSVDSNTIYKVPKILFDQNIHKSIFKYFKISKKGTMANWDKFLKTIESPKQYSTNIAVVGKYIELPDAYLSLIESLKIASYKTNVDLNLSLVDATLINESNYKKTLSKYDGILVPGGFGERGIEGKTFAAKYARENDIPYFGICLGMQTAAIDFAKNVLNLEDPNSTEFKLNPKNPIFTLIHSTKNDIGGTLRLGNQEINILKNTLAFDIYRNNKAIERHRHRWAFNKEYIEMFEKNGMKASALSNDNKVVEILEYTKNKFFIGVQYHPEFQSRPLNPNPLFEKFILATIKK